MLHAKRRAIAYIIGRMVTGNQCSTVYDCLSTSYHNLGGTVAGHVNVYDYARSCSLIGTRTSIFDDGTGQYISLEVKGNSFSGYDYETSSFFSGSVNGGSINLYDNSDQAYFGFLI